MSLRRTIVSIAIAAVLWFIMFSPWTKGLGNFWMMMTGSALILTGLVVIFSGGLPMFGSCSPEIKRQANGRLRQQKALFTATWLSQISIGILTAAALWGIFWIGDKVSSMMFDFARPGVDAVYAMKTGLPQWLIAVLLLFVIGPAEELFWRGFVQRSLSELKSPDFALVVTTLVYALVHIWSFNFMLVMAALVAGAVWGLLYRLRPQWLPALIISHALWDAAVFVVFPIL